MSIPFLNNIIVDDSGHIQFKTAAGANAGKINQDGNNLVLTNAVGDILLGDGSSDVYIGDGTNNVDIIFEQSGAIKGDGSAITLTLGGANTTLNLENPNINGSVTLPTTTINSKMTFGTSSGYILFDYEPTTDSGEYSSEIPLLRVDRSGTELTILSRVTNNGGVILGNDDGVAILAGDVKGVIKSNLNLASEAVVIASEGGFKSYSFPNNDTSWSNRNEFNFYGSSSTASSNGLYIGDGGSTQFIDLNRNLINIGTISSGAISATGDSIIYGKTTVYKSSSHTAQGSFSANNAHLDLYNPLQANTDQKGSIITFTDNYYDGSNYQKTTRAAIKGGTDTTGNTADGYLEFYTDSGGSNSPTLALRLDNDLNATFAGTIGSGAITSTGKITGTELEGTSLDINGDGAIDGKVIISDDDNGALTIRRASNTDQALYLRGGAGSGEGRVAAQYSLDLVSGLGGSNSYDLKLITSTGTALQIDASDSNKAIFSGPITSTGQITGTELEGTSLDINGNADISGDLVITGNIKNNIENGTLDFYGGTDATNDAHIRLHGNNTQWGSLYMDFGYDAANSKFIVNQGGTERFKIQNNVAYFSGKIQGAGEIEGTSLDINGNADISGETTFKPKHYAATDDLNSDTRTIFSTHSTNGSTSNRPVNWSTIYTLGGSGTNALQISTNEDYEESGMWIRQYNQNNASPQGTGWQNWTEVHTTNTFAVADVLNSNVTLSSLGAAAASHEHSAADITSGTLPVSRGGTGLTSQTLYLNSKSFSNFLSTNADWDTVNTRGTYRLTGSSNSMFGGSHSTGLVVTQDDGNYGWQLFSNSSSNNTEGLKYRYKSSNAGGWGATQTILTKTFGDGRYLLDSEVTNLADVKAFDPSDYATSTQGGTADSALQNVVEDTSPQLGSHLDMNGMRMYETNEATASIDLRDHSSYTWFRNSANAWVFQGGTSGDDWTQSVRLTLESIDSSNNNKWVLLGQQNANQTEGKYKGVRIVKYNSGTIDGDLQAGDATFSGDLTVTGNLNITGDINSYNVTDLDVTDKTITIGAGQTEANSGGSGIIVDGSSASMLWNETDARWDFNKNIYSAGTIVSATTVTAQTGLRALDSDGTNVHGFMGSNANEGTLRISNGSNWGFIARGVSNDPRIGAYHGGQLKIEGFHNSDGSEGANTVNLAQFNFSAGKLNVNGNITLTGTVDGVDIATRDALMVTTTGDQTISGRKTYTHGDGVMIQSGSQGNAIRLVTNNDAAQIADTFAANTAKSYIYFDARTSSNDPGYIMHETSSSEANEAVLHLVPSDDNSYGDYVSIHGTNDADCLKLHTSGRIETASGYELSMVSGSGSVKVDDSLLVTGNVNIGANESGRSLYAYGAATGEGMFWNGSDSHLTIKHDDGDLGLEIYPVNSTTPTVPQLKIGRDNGQYWGVYTTDRDTFLIHRQDETSGQMNTNFDQWDSNTTDPSGEWRWRSGDGTGASMVNAMSLTKGGVLTLGGTSQIKSNTDLSLVNPDGEYFLYGASNAQVALYHNGVKKFETTSTGASIIGNIDLTPSSSDILMIDNSGAALEVKQGSDLYMRFITTNGGEHIEVNKNIELQGVTATSGSFSSTLTVTGAGNSSNWKTAYDHSQVAHAPSNAEQNVQSDWTETTTTSDAFILNKPSTFTPSSHTHSATEITSGILPTARLAEFLADKHTYTPNENGSSSGGYYMPMVKGGVYTTSDSSKTGYLKIKVPTFAGNQMMSFTVDIYEYNNDRSQSIKLGGYNYASSSPSWYNTFAIATQDSDNRNLNVRYITDGTNDEHFILIGESDTNWTYPQVVVRDWLSGYSTSLSEMTGSWDLDFVTSFTGSTNSTHSDNHPYAHWDRIEDKPSTFAPSSHNHDDRYYTETELNAGQLDNRYYTESELNAGQLDNRYYTESEMNASWYNASTTRSKFTTTDGTQDDYTFKVDDEGNISGNKWYHVATTTSGSGGLHMRGFIANHVESFAAQKFNLAIQVRQGNDGGQLEITGSVDVLDNDTATNGTDKVGVRVIKSAENGTYDEFKVYIRTCRYSQAHVRMTQEGSFTFNTDGSSVTTEPAPVTGGHLEIDTSNGNSGFTEGNHLITDSQIVASFATTTIGGINGTTLYNKEDNLVLMSGGNNGTNLQINDANGEYLFTSGDVRINEGSLSISADGSSHVVLSESGSGDFKIDAAGDITLDAGGNDIRFKVNNTEYGKFKSDSSDFSIYSSIQDKDILFKGNDGGTTITALTLDMSAAGKATFNNDVVAFSDKKLKENIKTLDGSKVLEMRGVSFDRKDTGLPSSGVIAQEMQKVAPELVSETNGTLGVSYGNITGYLIEAIKDLKQEVEELKKQIKNGNNL